MIIEQRIKDFEQMSFGLFVHFGLYSVHGKGEWAYNINIKAEEYHTLTEKFNPDVDWAQQLVLTAKNAGCKYITLTARHHDGFPSTTPAVLIITMHLTLPQVATLCASLWMPAVNSV